MNATRPRKGEPGTVCSFRVAEGRFVGLQYLGEVMIAVLDGAFSEPPTLETCERLTARAAMFVHKSSKRAMTVLGRSERVLDVRACGFTQSIGNAEKCELHWADGRVEPATPEYCVGVERVMLWELEHLTDRLSQTFWGGGYEIPARYQLVIPTGRRTPAPRVSIEARLAAVEQMVGPEVRRIQREAQRKRRQ